MAGFVPVRVMDMSGVDLTVFRFDYDLTFAVLLMHADGTIYHTFGGRDWTHADSHLAMAPLVELCRAALTAHAAYQADPSPPKRSPPFTIEQYPWMAGKIRNNQRPKCMHCHMVNDARHHTAKAAGRYRTDDAFEWPDPVQVGLRPDREQQAQLAEVTGGSAARRAGLRAGDRLVRVGDRPIGSFGDLARALHDVPEHGGSLAVEFRRGDEPKTATLRLPAGWKRPDPEVFAWRPSKWPMDPKPGFGGPKLDADACETLGLPRDAFAFRVQYIVTWGDDAFTGRNAQQAGIRKGDVVWSVCGKRDFVSVAHFHAWFRLTLRAGQQVPIEIVRGGQRRQLMLPVVVK